MSTNDCYNNVRTVSEILIQRELELVRQVCHFLDCVDKVEDAQQHFIYSDLVKKCLKTKKDVNAPKKPRSSYIMYCNSIRKEVTETHPTLKMHEISKKLSERWNGITDEVKKKFQEDAEKDRERYKTEHDVYKDKLCEQNGSLTGIGSSNSSC